MLFRDQDADNYPEFDRNKYTVWAWPNPLIIHWVVNPGLAFNELILGQRIPKVMLIDRTSEEPLGLRTYVPCPHCQAFHPSRLWGKGNAFGHWFGYLCPTCENIIPCLWNWTSLVLLTITFPLWYFPARLLKSRFLAWEKIRLQRNLDRPPTPLTSVKPVKVLLLGTFGWGGFMWLFMCVVPFLYHYWTSKTPTVDIGPVIYGLPLMLSGGFCWGLLMFFFMSRRGKKLEVLRQAQDDKS